MHDLLINLEPEFSSLPWTLLVYRLQTGPSPLSTHSYIVFTRDKNIAVRLTAVADISSGSEKLHAARDCKPETELPVFTVRLVTNCRRNVCVERFCCIFRIKNAT